MSHIFISYARDDLDFVVNLSERLRTLGLDVWVDLDSLRAGEDWRFATDEAIRNAQAVIVILSPESSQSQFVTYEWSYAIGLGIRVIPILLKKTNVHPRLETLQYFDFTSPINRPWDILIRMIRDFDEVYSDVPDELTLKGIESFDVFLSYSRKNIGMMQRIRDDLQTSGFEVWTDEDLEPGTPSWQKAIEQAIETVKAMVVLLSPDSKQSIWVERELTYARVQRRTILPVLIEGDEASAVPIALINAQRLDIVHYGYLPEMNKLVAAIQSELKS